MNRRDFFYFSTGAAALLAGGAVMWRSSIPDSARAASSFEIVRSEQEWRAMLTEPQYRVLREHGTERAFSSPLDGETRQGLFHCAGCDLPVYSSAAKYDSGTGWPSFWESLPDAIGTSVDNTLFATRTECHCRRCGGHFGHIFDDGPPPTNKRHCLNGVALSFKPATA